MREMKQTNITWASQIPKHWSVMPNKYIMTKIKRICDIHKGEDIISLSMNGVIVRDLEAGGKMPTSFNGYQFVYPGNLLMCLFDYDVTPRCIGYINNYGITSPAYSQFVMKNNNCAKYYYYYYLMLDHTKELLHLAKNLRHSFTEDELGRINQVVPPVEEQEAIARFLDKECAKIDSIYADVEKQIETLEQCKRSVIQEAVTKGLNPNVELKDSGMKWIGQVPSTWKIDKIKYHLRRNERRNPGNQQVLSVYREYGVIPKDSRDDNHNVTSEDVSKYKYVKPGYLVINKMKAWQGSMGISEYEGIVSPAYFIFEFSDDLFEKKYIHYLLRGCYKDEFRRISGGIREGQWDLSPEGFMNTYILIPSICEQREIVEYIDKKCVEIESVIADKKKQLEVLDNYKKSLIYEYVTGKKEVVNE